MGGTGRSRLILAGLLLVVGLALVANRWFSSRIEVSAASSVDELRALRGRPKAVTPRAPMDWAKRRYKVRGRDALFAADPRSAPSFVDPFDLRVQGKELAEHLVTLTRLPRGGLTFTEKKRTFTAVGGTAGDVWLVSKAEAPVPFTGRVVPFFDLREAPALADAFNRREGHAVPPTALAIEQDAPVAPTDDVETWIPATGAVDVFFVASGTPADAPPAGGPSVAEHTGARTLVYLQDVATYRAAHPGEGRVSWIGVVVLIVALGLFGISAFL